MLLVCLLLAVTPAEVVAEFDRMAAQPPWPGWAPLKTALAISDGRKTEFFRHPKPPAEYVVRANTSETIEGVATATLLLNEKRSAREQAAVLMHEAFHVYQRERHPEWRANEATLFTYPVENERAQALALLEVEALRRAVAGGTGCWGTSAKRLRAERFGLLSEADVAYERGNELNEGLAQYVEGLTLGEPGARLAEGGYAPEAVRSRLYATGQAWAVLASRQGAGWQEKIRGSLDELAPESDLVGCVFHPSEVRAAEEKARGQVAALVAGRRAERERYLGQAGWTVVVRFAKPAGLAGFDPMNVTRLEGGEVLHTRMLMLKAGEGGVEVLGRKVLSRPAGGHPLFSGVRELVLAGAGENPVKEGQVTVEGVKITARPTAVKTEGRTVTVELP